MKRRPRCSKAGSRSAERHILGHGQFDRGRAVIVVLSVGGFVHREIRDGPRFVATEQRFAVTVDLVIAQRHMPDAHLRQFPKGLPTRQMISDACDIAGAFGLDLADPPAIDVERGRSLVARSLADGRQMMPTRRQLGEIVTAVVELPDVIEKCA